MRILLLLFVLSAKMFGQLPDAPSAVDRSFWAVTTASAVSTAADAYTTVDMIGGHSCPFEETSPTLYGRNPSAARTTLVMGGLFAASVATSYVLKRVHARIWKLPLWPAPEAYLAYGHAYGAIHNFRHC